MRKRCCGTGEHTWQARQAKPEQGWLNEIDLEHIGAALTRSFEGIMAISDEVKERLAEIKGCPEPCGSGVVKIAPSSGQTKSLPCPFLEPGCHYGKRM